MNDDPLRCENCGAILASPDAVCLRCERELTESPFFGKYRCPNCASRFDQPALGWWPPNVPWYRPQIQKPECPQCKAYLRDRKTFELTIFERWGMRALVFASIFSPWRPGTQIVALAIFVPWSITYYLRWRKARSSVLVEEERYAARVERNK